MKKDNALFPRLEQLNVIGASLSKEHDIHRLIEAILVAAKTITHADGGTLYLLTEDRSALRFEIMRTDSLNISMGGTTGQPVTFPDLPLVDNKGRPNTTMVAAYAAIHLKTINRIRISN